VADDREALLHEWQRLKLIASPDFPYKIPDDLKAEADKCASMCIRELYDREKSHD
jgi:hypothetical protein